MFTAVLVFHIASAIVMGFSAALLLFAVWKNHQAPIGLHAQVLSWGLGAELVSGSLLALLSTNAVSFTGFCQNIVLYVCATGGVLLVAHLRTRQAIPAGALVPILPSIMLSSLTAVHLF